MHGILEYIALVVAVVIVAVGFLVRFRLRQPLLQFLAESRRLTALVEESHGLKNIDTGRLTAPGSTTLSQVVAHLVAAGKAATSPPGEAHRQLNDNLLPSMRAMDAAPNQFVGLGLLFTFGLLAFSIYLAGAGLNSNAAGEMEAAMRNLLATAGIKFVTSIAAIFVSLMLISDRTKLLADSDAALSTLASAIELRMPLVAGGSTADIAIALAAQADSMANIEDSIAMAVEEREQTLARALTGALHPLAESVAEMGNRVATTNAETMEKMVKAFAEQLGGATLRYNQDLAETLRVTSAALQDTPAQVKAAAMSMTRMLDDARERTEAVIQSSNAALEATASRMEAIARQASAAEVRLAENLDRATAEANAATQRLDMLTTKAEAAGAHFSTIADRATTAASAMADATSAAGGATAAARALQSGIKSDMAEWTAGMREVDVQVGKILSNAAPFLKGKPTSPSVDDSSNSTPKQ